MSSNENISPLMALCVGNSPVTGEFPSQRPVTRSFDALFDLHLLNKRLSKQTWGWWFETPSCSLWRHCNGNSDCHIHMNPVPIYPKIVFISFSWSATWSRNLREGTVFQLIINLIIFLVLEYSGMLWSILYCSLHQNVRKHTMSTHDKRVLCHLRVEK